MNFELGTFYIVPNSKFTKFVAKPLWCGTLTQNAQIHGSIVLNFLKVSNLLLSYQEMQSQKLWYQRKAFLCISEKQVLIRRFCLVKEIWPPKDMTVFEVLCPLYIGSLSFIKGKCSLNKLQ